MVTAKIRYEENVLEAIELLVGSLDPESYHRWLGETLDNLDTDTFLNIVAETDHKVVAPSFNEHDFNILIDRVEAWADDKGTLSNGTPLRQIIKTLEEVHETMEATYNNDEVEMVDGCGDALITLIIYAHLIGKTPHECLNAALEVIEKRTGRMINNTFVKDK